MSQSGLLNEEEIKNYISDSFNIRLERDQFIKPTKEFVFDIYSRFLDDLNKRWRNSDADEPNIKAIMVAQIRSLLKHYNTAPIFQYTDIASPTRKRTTTFLNVLIFIKAQLDDERFKYQSKKEERAAYQEEAQRLKSENTQLLRELEELYIKKGTAKTLEELIKENKEKTRVFESVSRECDVLAEGAKEIKKRIIDLTEENKIKERRLETLDDEINQRDAILKSLEDGPMLKERCTNLEISIENKRNQLQSVRNECQDLEKKISSAEKFLILDEAEEVRDDVVAIQTRLDQARNAFYGLTGRRLSHVDREKEINQDKEKMSIQFKIEIERAKAKLAERLAERDERCQQDRAKQEQKRLKIEGLRKARNSILATGSAFSEKCKINVEQAKRKVEMLPKYVQDCEEALHDIKTVRANRKHRLETLIGKPKEIEQLANRTYTKPSDCTYIKEISSQ